MERHFAAMKIPDSDPDYKLTRAVSFSELPSARRICVEQAFHVPYSSGLVRQYSCEQIFDNSFNTKQVKISEIIKTGTNEHSKTWETGPVQFDNFKVPPSNWQSWPKNNIIQPAKLTQDKVEYMEIDEIDPPKDSLLPENSSDPPLSKSCPNPAENIDIKSIENNDTDGKGSLNAVSKPNYEDIKKRIRPLVSTQTKNMRTSRCSCFMILFFILLPITILLFGIFISNEVSLNNPCDHKKNFLNASIELEEKVYGQSVAIRQLVDYLHRNDSCSKIIALVGGTGVGKSYTAEILRHNFSNKNKIFLYFPPLQSNAKVNALSRLFCNLVILENLGENDLIDFINYVKVIRAKESYCVTVVGLFNMEQVEIDLIRKVDLEENVKMIEESLQADGIPAATIGYKALTEDVLEKCIIDAAIDSDLNLTKKQIDFVKQKLILFNSGCKGAYSKVQLVGRE